MKKSDSKQLPLATSSILGQPPNWFALAVAILITLRFVLFVLFVVSGGQYVHPDTAIYLELAGQMFENGVFVLPETQSLVIEPFGVPSAQAGRVLQSDVPYGPEVFRTPGYPAFLAALSWLGISNPYGIVFIQELIYGLAVFIFYKYGRALFSEKILRAGLIFMLIDPGGFAFPKLLISETLFLPFLIGGVLALGCYLRQPNWRYLVVSGVVMGLGAWVRPAIAYFPVIAGATLIFFDWRNPKRWMASGLLVLCFFITLSPWLIRNYYHFNKVILSGQTSNMLANYHVPMVWLWENVIPYYDGQDSIRQQVAEARLEREKILGRPVNAAEFFELQQHFALKELGKYPASYFKAWIEGCLKTMYEPYAFELYDVMKISDQRIHFSEIMSGNFKVEEIDFFDSSSQDRLARIFYYLIHQDKLYLMNVLMTLLIFVFALPGVFNILSKKDCFLWILLLANFYFICAPGPMGYARFRFPVDVFWFIQACLGLLWVVHLLKHLKQQSTLLADKHPET